VNRLRWRTIDLMVLVLLVALALAAYRFFYAGRSGVPWRFVFSANLAVLTLATLASFYGVPPWQRVCQSYAIFGWLYLVLILRLGLFENTLQAARGSQDQAAMGMLFGLMCALAAYLLPRLTNANVGDEDKTRP